MLQYITKFFKCYIFFVIFEVFEVFEIFLYYFCQHVSSTFHAYIYLIFIYLSIHPSIHSSIHLLIHSFGQLGNSNQSHDNTSTWKQFFSTNPSSWYTHTLHTHTHTHTHTHYSFHYSYFR